MIVLLVMTDGRVDCITQTIAAAEANIHGPITRRIIHDDSGNEDYQEWLGKEFPTYDLIGHHGQRRGFGGAIRSAWEYLVENEDSQPERFVFHLEDDFTIDRQVDLSALVVALEATPYLVQLALRRQPWNDTERAAGGIVESNPGDYTQCDGSYGTWLEHRRFFTTNPSLYRRSLCRVGWPEGEQSEGHFSHKLFAGPNVRCGFWGARNSGEWVTHIGRERAGAGY